MTRHFRPLILALVLGACGLTRPPEMNVEDQWADALRRLGLFSLYPSTEDALPGDVLLLVPPPYGLTAVADRLREGVIPGARPAFDGTRFSLIRLGSLGSERPGDARQRRVQDMNMLDHIAEQQRERPRIQSLPALTAARLQRAGNAPQVSRDPTQPLEGHDRADFAIGHADQDNLMPRLQRSAIPSLTVARVTEAQLGGAGILGNLGLNLASSSGNAVALTIALRDVQELPLEPWRARLLLEERGALVFAERITPGDLLYWLRIMRIGRRDTHSLMSAACTGDAAALARQNVQVAVVNRVVYAGAIEYSFSQRTIAAVRAALDLQGASAANIRLPPQIPSLVIVTNPGAGTTPPPADASAVPIDQARAALATQIASLTGLPGGATGRAGLQATFGIGTLGSLSLVEIFNRPIAVGFGSRLFLSFHEALTGVDPASEEARFQETVRICADEFRTLTTDESASLRRAMLGPTPAPDSGFRRQVALPRMPVQPTPSVTSSGAAPRLATPPRPRDPSATEPLRQQRSLMRAPPGG